MGHQLILWFHTLVCIKNIIPDTDQVFILLCNTSRLILVKLEGILVPLLHAYRNRLVKKWYLSIFYLFYLILWERLIRYSSIVLGESVHLLKQLRHELMSLQLYNNIMTAPSPRKQQCHLMSLQSFPFLNVRAMRAPSLLIQLSLRLYNNVRALMTHKRNHQ